MIIIPLIPPILLPMTTIITTLKRITHLHLHNNHLEKEKKKKKKKKNE